MAQEPAIIDLLAAQHREWRTRFPALSNRAQQAIVGYLCTRGRSGVPVRQIYGVTKELFLLDDATVRERVEEILRLGLCQASPETDKISGRTLITPTAALLAGFDAYLLVVAQHLCAMAGVGAGPAALNDRDRSAILQAFDSYAIACLAAADRFLLDQAVSPARRAEARRRLTATSYWTLMHQAIEHASQVEAGAEVEPSLVADQLAAGVLDQTGQSFQTIRDHISWLISQGFLSRHPGRVLRVSLTPAAAAQFALALGQVGVEMAELASRLGPTATQAGAWPRRSFDEGDPAEQTIRMKLPLTGRAASEAPQVEHWLEITDPPEAAGRILLSDVPTVIGRVRPAQVLLADGSVSRAHCQVEVVGDAVQLTDLSSTNGTYVDGARVDGTVTLAAGGEVRIGPYTLEYRHDGEGCGRHPGTEGENPENPSGKYQN